jgi:hypothetical protein
LEERATRAEKRAKEGEEKVCDSLTSLSTRAHIPANLQLSTYAEVHSRLAPIKDQVPSSQILELENEIRKLTTELRLSEAEDDEIKEKEIKIPPKVEAELCVPLFLLLPPFTNLLQA